MRTEDVELDTIFEILYSKLADRHTKRMLQSHILERWDTN